MNWKLIHLPTVYSLICPHNALVSHLKVVPGFQAYYILSDSIMHDCFHCIVNSVANQTIIVVTKNKYIFGQYEELAALDT